MFVFSADKYFLKAGEYSFDPKMLPEAHASCLRQFVRHIQGEEKALDLAAKVTILRGVPGSGKSTWALNNESSFDLVVDNTNTQLWEMAPYISLANAFHVPVEVITLDCDPKVAAARNVHGVPEKSVLSMADRLKQGTADLKKMMPWIKHTVIFQEVA